MNLANRLRGVVRSVPATHAETGEAASGVRALSPRRPADGSADPATLLGGEWREWQGQTCLVIDRRYPPGHRHGRVSVADAAPGGDDGWPTLSILNPLVGCGRMLFVDLETTGLAGGAGTYAFLVGCGWFEGAAFRIRQFLLTSFGAERGLLAGLAETASTAATLGTFNGKTFDLPLIETRFLFHRLAMSMGQLPHVDMLHPARRLWRSDESCRLSVLEQSVLGHVRDADVPGFEIPSRYFHYVRTGDVRPLEAVVEHNRLDLLSLAMLTATAASLFEAGLPAVRTAREALGMGRIYEQRGMWAEARGCYAYAAGLTPAPTDTSVHRGDEGPELSTRIEGLRSYALLSRRMRRFDDAATAWGRLLHLPPRSTRSSEEAAEALAIHHEHRVRDLHTARRFAAASLELTTTPARGEAVRRRFARLDRKLTRTTPPLAGHTSPRSASLF